VTPFVTVPPAPLLKGRFLELADIGEVGLVSVFTKILPPQAPESVATGMLGGMKVKLLFYQMLNRSRHFYFTVAGVKNTRRESKCELSEKSFFIYFFFCFTSKLVVEHSHVSAQQHSILQKQKGSLCTLLAHKNNNEKKNL
jgi:hypothetical protein